MHVTLYFYKFEMTEYIGMVVHIILMCCRNPKLFGKVSEPKQKQS